MEIEEINFNCTIPIQIRFNDIDAIGHINNNVYLSYFDLGKSSYFEAIRGTAINWLDSAIVIVHMEIDFLRPVFYREEIVVDSKIIKLGDKSGVFVQQIRNPKTDAIKCRCKSVFVAFDATSQKSTPIPDTWRTAISKFEGIEM